MAALLADWMSWTSFYVFCYFLLFKNACVCVCVCVWVCHNGSRVTAKTGWKHQNITANKKSYFCVSSVIKKKKKCCQMAKCTQSQYDMKQRLEILHSHSRSDCLSSVFTAHTQPPTLRQGAVTKVAMRSSNVISSRLKTDLIIAIH